MSAPHFAGLNPIATSETPCGLKKVDALIAERRLSWIDQSHPWDPTN